MLSYENGDGVELTVEYLDGNDNPTLPNTSEYSLYCESTKKELIGWTALAVQTDTLPNGLARYYSELEIPGSANIIQSTKNRREVKTLTVTTNRGQSDQKSAKYRYLIEA